MPRLILLRHGQSQWNLENRFTGWVDVDLTDKGEAEARRGGDLIAASGFRPDVMFLSVLKRARRTGALALQAAGLKDVPVIEDWRLNERHYGGLTGLNKAETAEKHGEDQVRIWRRSYDVPPPPLAPGGEYDFHADPRYAGQIVAHGNSLRAIVKHLFQVPDDKIVGVEIPTGNPLEIDLDSDLKPVAARYLDADRAQALPVLP